MKVIKAEELRDLVAEIFQKRGVPEEDSLIASNSLVHANLRGVDSHGVMRVGHYIRRIEAGSIGITTFPSLSATMKSRLRMVTPPISMGSPILKASTR